MKIFLLICLFSSSIYASSENDVITALWLELGHTRALEGAAAIKKQKSTDMTLVPRELEEINKRKRNIERKVESHGQEYTYSDYSNLGPKLPPIKQERALSEVRLKWKKARDKYLENISTYKGDRAISISNSSKILFKNSAIIKDKNYVTINSAFEINIKDQQSNTNGTALSGASAIEIMLRQNNSNIEVSNSFSTSSCKKAVCENEKISSLFKRSKASTSFDIPTSKDCPTMKKSQTASLNEGCKNRKVKIDDYETIMTLTEVASYLNKSSPVLARVNLSENFYTSTGIITYQDSLLNGKINNHTIPHTILLIGYMKLPKKLNQEGQNCYLVLNSWTKGWGSGGYGCITEKWFSTYRSEEPFIALTKIRSL